MQEAMITTDRLKVCRLLVPWKNLLCMLSNGCCTVRLVSRSSLEALTLLMLAVRVDPLVVNELGSAGWFCSYRCQQPANTSVRASINVECDVAVLVPFFGHQPPEDGPFLEAVRALKALDSMADSTVVIPIAVRVRDHGKMRASDYSEHLSKLLTSPLANTEARFEATSLHVTPSGRSLSPQLVEAVIKMARDSPTITFADVAIDPFLVSCSSDQFVSSIAAAARSSSSMTASITLDIRSKASQVTNHTEAVPMVCRALCQLNHFNKIALGALFSASRCQLAQQAVLDAIVSLLVRTDSTSATVDKLSLASNRLRREDDSFLREWVATNPANQSLLSSSTIGTLTVNPPGVRLLQSLLPSLDSVQCAGFIMQGSGVRSRGRNTAAFKLLSLAPSKFASILFVAISRTVMVSGEMDAIASLPRLEALELKYVSLDQAALLQFIASLVPPPSVASWQRRQFKRLTLNNCVSGDNNRRITDEAMGQLLLQVLNTNRYLASVAIVEDRVITSGVWRLVQAHDGDDVLANTDTRALCGLLSVLHARESLLVGGGKLDEFTVRRIVEFSRPHRVRRVRVANY